MQSKLNQINDRATTSDWAAMEQLINAQPSLVAKPWYQTGWGIGGMIGGVALIATASFFLFSTNEETISPSDEIVVEETINSQKSVEVTSQNSETVTDGISYEEAQEESVTEISESAATASNSNPFDKSTDGVINSTENSIASSEVPANMPSVENPSVDFESSEDVVEQNQLEENVTEPVLASNTTSETNSSSNNESTNSTVPQSPLSTDSQNNSMEMAEAGTESANSTNSGTGTAASHGSPDLNANSAASTDNGSSSQSESVTMATNQTSNSPSNSNSANPASTSSKSASSSAPNLSPVLIDDTERNAWGWSVSAYADYNLNSPQLLNSEIQSNEVGNFMGAGLEVEGEWRGWTAVTGFMAHRESSLFKTEQYFTDTNRHGVTWYEIDTTYHEVYDSTWVPNGGNGYWDIDTTLEARTNERLAEGFGFTYTNTLVKSQVSTSGYRYSVPLLIGKRWSVNRWNFGLQGGPVFIMRSTTWFYNGEFHRTTADRSFDLLFRAEVGYDILPSLSIFGRAGLRTNMERISNLRQNAWSTQSVPASLGLRYTF